MLRFWNVIVLLLMLNFESFFCDLLAHSSKNGTFIQKWHIHPKMAHSNKNGTFIQKWHIPPKVAHSFDGTFLRKWHIPSKMAHSSENGTFLSKWHIPPKMANSSKNDTFLQKWHIPPKMAHSCSNDAILPRGFQGIIKQITHGMKPSPNLVWNRSVRPVLIFYCFLARWLDSSRI